MTNEQEIRFQCTNCHKRLKSLVSHAGKKARCTGCGGQVTVPVDVVDLVAEKSEERVVADLAQVPAQQWIAHRVQMPLDADQASVPQRSEGQVGSSSLPSPPLRPLSRSVVWGGVYAFGAMCLIIDSVAKWCGSPFAIYEMLFICTSGGALFAGYFVGGMANNRHSTHALFSGILCLAVLIIGLTGYIFGTVIQQDKSIQITNIAINAWLDVFVRWQIFAVLCLFIISFTFGVLLDRWLLALVRTYSPRKSGTYLTDAKEKIVAQGPQKYIYLAWFWWLISWLFIVVCWVPLWSEGSIFTKVFGLFNFLVLGRVCLLMSTRRTAQDGRDALRDIRPPIIYLRSFKHDGRRTQESALGDYTRGVFSLLGVTPEQQLAKTMKRHGPFVAIGRPGESLPEIGASRIYVSDNDWQTVVADMLRKEDALAVLQAGESQGLRWELEQLGSKLKAEQVLLFIPFRLWAGQKRGTKQYLAFRKWAQTCLPVALPQSLGESSFIYFTEKNGDWKAHLLTRKSAPRQRHPLWPILRSLQRTSKFWPRSFAYGCALAILLTFLLLILCIVSSAFSR